MILFFVNIGVLLLLAALCPRPQLGRYRIDAQKLYVVLAMGYLMLLAALRSPVVGTDTLSYCRYFRSAASCDSLHRAWSVLRLCHVSVSAHADHGKRAVAAGGQQCFLLLFIWALYQPIQQDAVDERAAVLSADAV